MPSQEIMSNGNSSRIRLTVHKPSWRLHAFQAGIRIFVHYSYKAAAEVRGQGRSLKAHRMVTSRCSGSSRQHDLRTGELTTPDVLALVVTECDVLRVSGCWYCIGGRLSSQFNNVCRKVRQGLICIPQQRFRKQVREDLFSFNYP